MWFPVFLLLCSPSWAAEEVPSDVKINFASVVETYIRQNSPEGFWPLKDSRTGRRFALKLQDVDKNSIAEAEDGAYKGRAKLAGLSGKPEVKVDFTVDFTGLWGVKHYEVASERESREAGDETLSPAAYSGLVKRYVQAASRKTAAFVIGDPLLKKRWKLKLRKIHSDRLLSPSDDQFVGCVDFDEISGKESLDLDFYVKKKESGWAVDEVLIHAVDGKPRFAYDETNRRSPVPAP